MKYISADKLIAKIVELRKELPNTIEHLNDEESGFARGQQYELTAIEAEILCLQQEQPSLPANVDEAAIQAAQIDMCDRQIMEDSIEHRMLYSRIFRRGFKAGAEWMASREEQEQPEVDLGQFDKDVTKIWGRCAAEPNDLIACLHIDTFNEVARYFYELGLNARKEE